MVYILRLETRDRDQVREEIVKIKKIVLMDLRNKLESMVVQLQNETIVIHHKIFSFEVCSIE